MHTRTIKNIEKIISSTTSHNTHLSDRPFQLCHHHVFRPLRDPSAQRDTHRDIQIDTSSHHITFIQSSALSLNFIVTSHIQQPIVPISSRDHVGHLLNDIHRYSNRHTHHITFIQSSTLHTPSSHLEFHKNKADIERPR